MKAIATFSAFCLLLSAALPCTASPAAAQAAPGAPALAAPTFLAPAPNALLDAPVGSVTVQFPQGATVTLTVNNAPAKGAQVGRTETDSIAHLTTQVWYGLSLKHGPNTISAQIVQNGIAGPTATLPEHVRDNAATLVLTPRAPHMLADGRSTVTILGRLLDKWGSPAGSDGIVYLDSDGGR